MIYGLTLRLPQNSPRLQCLDSSHVGYDELGLLARILHGESLVANLRLVVVCTWALQHVDWLESINHREESEVVPGV